MVEGVDDRFQHIDLASAFFVARHGAEGAADGEVGGGMVDVERGAIFVGGQVARARGFLDLADAFSPIGVVDEFCWCHTGCILYHIMGKNAIGKVGGRAFFLVWRLYMMKRMLFCC